MPHEQLRDGRLAGERRGVGESSANQHAGQRTQCQLKQRRSHRLLYFADRRDHDRQRRDASERGTIVEHHEWGDGSEFRLQGGENYGVREDFEAFQNRLMIDR